MDVGFHDYQMTRASSHHGNPYQTDWLLGDSESALVIKDAADLESDRSVMQYFQTRNDR